MNQSTKTTLILAAFAFIAALLMTLFVTERIPHLEDEIAYLHQARVFARGHLWGPETPDNRAFYQPFLLNFGERRIGKYPIGWPLVLALGEAVGMGWLVNPLIGAATAALTYHLARDLFDHQIGVVAGVLIFTSPFFLIQSSTYMSHAASALYVGVVLWSVRRMDVTAQQRWAAVGGVAAGLLAITRQLPAAVLAVVVGGYLLYQHRGITQIVRRYWPMAAISLTIACLQPLYLWIVTGSPTTNLYTLVWPYDRIGFGPEIGPYGGHTLLIGLNNVGADLLLWTSEMFGWWYLSWLPVVIGAVSVFRRKPGWGWLFLAPFVMVVVIHVAYWVGAQVYGPRYFYEAHIGLCILAAVGLRATLQRFDRQRWLYAVLGVLVAVNLTTYLPTRISEWHGLYGITRAPLRDLNQQRDGERVLVFVEGSRWVDYAVFFSQNSPWLDGPIVAAHDRGPAINDAIREAFPDREIWYYYDDDLHRTPPNY